ncbi:hypothetical protein ACLB2K_017023 [Fragaria x ananassa]
MGASQQRKQRQFWRALLCKVVVMVVSDLLLVLLVVETVCSAPVSESSSLKLQSLLQVFKLQSVESLLAVFPVLTWCTRTPWALPPTKETPTSLALLPFKRTFS